MRSRVIEMQPSSKKAIEELRRDALQAREVVKSIHLKIHAEITAEIVRSGVAGDDPASVKSQSLSECGNYIVVEIYHPNEKRKQKPTNDR